jgi:hypothetical protein
MACIAFRPDACGFNQASMCSGLIGMMQRSCPAAAISAGGASVIAANDARRVGRYRALRRRI